MRRFYFTIIALVAIFCCQAADENYTYLFRREESRRLADTLKSAKSAKDSIRILYDIFDLLEYDNKTQAAWKLLDVAKRNKEYDVVCDIVPHIAVMESRDSVTLDKLLAIVSELPESNMKRGVELFVNVEKVGCDAYYMPLEQRRHAVVEYAKEDLNFKNDIYQDIFDLYRMVIFIRYTSKGSMYLEYLARLEKMIEDLPEESKFLRNLFYTTAANFYSNNGFPDKAIASDRKLLEIIKNLERHYKSVGRKYRSLDRNYYICYRRMLRNYKALDLKEVKHIYAECARLAENDIDIRKAFYEDRRTTAYRLMAERKYADAIPYIKHALEIVDDDNIRQFFLNMMVEASDSVGDKELLLSSLKEYNELLHNKLSKKAEETMAELAIRYDVNNLKSDMTELELQKRDIELSTNQKIITVSLAALFLLAIALMLLYRSHFKQLQKNRDLEEANERLRNDMESLLSKDIPAGTVDLKVRSDAPHR